MFGAQTKIQKQVLLEQNLTHEIATTQKVIKSKTTTAERYLSITYLMGLDCRRYVKVLEDLYNDFILRVSNYPKTDINVYDLSNNYKMQSRNYAGILGKLPSNNSILFTNVASDREQALTSKGATKTNLSNALLLQL